MITVNHGLWQAETGWLKALPADGDPSLLLVFAPAELLRLPILDELRAAWPQALLLGCSTAGQICDVQMHDDILVVTALRFEHTRLQMAEAHLPSAEDSRRVGLQLAQALMQPDLKHVLVLAEGLAINGSALVDGIESGLPEAVTVSGGLAGDGGDFVETLICTRSGVFSRYIAAIGLYGSSLRVGCGSCGGWDPFGPERLITRSSGNELFEMDGQPALDLYAHYLGDYAAGLPATGLLFPLEIRLPGQEQTLVRTILGTHPERRSLIFAGDIPEGAYARLMKTNFEHLLDGAAQAAISSLVPLGGGLSPQAALLVSCIGRKMVLKQRTEEELEEVSQALGADAALTGFYSYGEIAPGVVPCESELHNQTMTVTVLAEVDPRDG
ncbi:MAG: hypothetical protein CVV27_03425 [Candidatus Melainabacteria bacterium HGW-Melainabacteria-1]|nr:MAG: hypothetical protein CVV27_03425 [Candidatus Melainabacteria bacterium HGW-Melainabacteria-1]